MIQKANIKQANFREATGRRVAELVSAEAMGTVGVTCRLVDIFPEDQSEVKRLPHMHEDIEEVIFVLHGGGKAWVDGEEADIAAGDVLVVPAGTRHRIINPGESQLHLLCFFPAATVSIP